MNSYIVLALFHSISGLDTDFVSVHYEMIRSH